MYDPTLPQAGTEIDAVQMRGQLNGLKDLIDAIQSITTAVVDGTNTLPPGTPAVVALSVSGDTLHFSFEIPRGEDGGEGMPGPPFSDAVVDGVTTLPAGDPATVESTFDGTTVHFTFGIPQGSSGSDGGQGQQGIQGVQGVPGAPGEVSLQQLTDAIATTSSNSNAVATLDTPFANDPPTLADLELMRAKMNELILALRR